MSNISLLSIEKIAKKAGARRFSHDAAEELRDIMEETANNIAEKSHSLSRHAGRKTVMEEDVRFVTGREEK